jgi:hypothetical protein
MIPAFISRGFPLLFAASSRAAPSSVWISSTPVSLFIAVPAEKPVVQSA